MKGLLLWLAQFGRTVWRCLTDLSFYREVRTKRLGEAASHLAIVVSAFWLVPLLVAFFVGANLAARGLDAFILEKFPADAAFKVQDGQFSDNLASPVVARFEQGGLFAVNTATSTVAFATGDWGLIVGQAGVLQRSAPDATVQTTAWPKDAKASFTRDQAQGGIHHATPWLILVFAILGLIFAAAGAAVSVAGLVAFHALLLWLLLRALKRPMKFYEAAVLAGYAATIPILFRVLFSGLGTLTGTLSTCLYWVMLGLIARDLWKQTPAGGTHLEPKPEGSADHSPGPDDGRA
jgi:hypothetical protein